VNFQFDNPFYVAPPEPDESQKRLVPTGGSWAPDLEYYYFETTASGYLYGLVSEDAKTRLNGSNEWDVEYNPSDGKFHDVGSSDPKNWGEDDTGTGLSIFPTASNMQTHFWYHENIDNVNFQFDNPFYVAPPQEPYFYRVTVTLNFKMIYNTLSTVEVHINKTQDTFTIHDIMFQPDTQNPNLGDGALIFDDGLTYPSTEYGITITIEPTNKLKFTRPNLITPYSKTVMIRFHTDVRGYILYIVFTFERYYNEIVNNEIMNLHGHNKGKIINFSADADYGTAIFIGDDTNYEVYDGDEFFDFIVPLTQRSNTSYNTENIDIKINTNMQFYIKIRINSAIFSVKSYKFFKKTYVIQNLQSLINCGIQ
jgi:hypothetical protein